jgi:hypothetical protein
MMILFIILYVVVIVPKGMIESEYREKRERERKKICKKSIGEKGYLRSISSSSSSSLFFLSLLL